MPRSLYETLERAGLLAGPLPAREEVAALTRRTQIRIDSAAAQPLADLAKSLGYVITGRGPVVGRGDIAAMFEAVARGELRVEKAIGQAIGSGRSVDADSGES